MYSTATIEKATSPEDVENFMIAHEDGTMALFFVDNVVTEDSKEGFWSGIVSSVGHIFGGDSGSEPTSQSAAAIERDVAEGAAMLQIDVNNESLQDVREFYDVTTVPFLIVFKRGVVVLREVPTGETHDKILQVLNVNPAAVHVEDEPQAPEQPAPAEQSEPVSVAPAEPVEEPRRVTLAPGDRAAPAPAPQHIDPDDRQKVVQHKCHNDATYDDVRAAHWRESPAYIKELEDYEIPETWWREGYSPLSGESAQTETVEPFPRYSPRETFVSVQPTIIEAPAIIPPIIHEERLAMHGPYGSYGPYGPHGYYGPQFAMASPYPVMGPAYHSHQRTVAAPHHVNITASAPRNATVQTAKPAPVATPKPVAAPRPVTNTTATSRPVSAPAPKPTPTAAPAPSTASRPTAAPRPTATQRPTAAPATSTGTRPTTVTARTSAAPAGATSVTASRAGPAPTRQPAPPTAGARRAR